MNAVVLRSPDKTAKARDKKYGYRYVVQEGWELPEERTLFVAQGTAVPYGLLEAGFGFLERWEVAAPLWRYGVLAKDLGTPVERKRTEEVILDLRVLLYAHELLFVRAGGAGEEFLQEWRRQCEGGGDERLAFLRALHLVKPVFCALPCSWMAGAAQRAAQDQRAGLRSMKQFAVGRSAAGRPVLTEVRRGTRGAGLVQVEIAPGRYVQCEPGQEEMIKAKFADLALDRRERRRRAR